MAAIRHVSKSQPCPICGKPDWCGNYIRQDGKGIRHVCMRASAHDVIGQDGQNYVYVMETENGALIFEEESQYKANKSWDKNFDFRECEIKRLERGDEIIEPFDNETLDKIYRCMLSKMELYPFHREYLLGEGWNNEMIDMAQIKSMPVSDFKKNHDRSLKGRKQICYEVMKELSLDSLKGVPGAFLNEGDWDLAGHSGIVFPMYDHKGNLYRMRIRLDYQDIPFKVLTEGTKRYFYKEGTKYQLTFGGVRTLQGEKVELDLIKGKYRNLTSSYDEEKNGKLYNQYYLGCAAGSTLSLYVKEGDDISMCYIAEGEKKAIYANFVLSSPCISFPGTGGVRFLDQESDDWLQALIDMGVKIFCICVDADKDENEKVLECEEKIKKKVTSKDVHCAVCSWDKALGKGLDDLLAGGNLPVYSLVK